MEKQKARMRFYDLKSIRWRITLLFLVIIFVQVMHMFWITKQAHVNANLAALEKVKGDLRLGEALLDALYPGPWAIINGKLYKGRQIMNNNFAIVDMVGKLTGNTCTIFQGDTRVATNVIRNGSRAVGTKVSKEVGQVVLEQGREFYGEAEVVGIKYQTAYKPIKDQAGRNIGIWYVGANNQYVDNIFRNSVKNLWSTLIINFFLTAVIFWLLTKSLVRPVRELVNYANLLAQGELDTAITVKTQDEIGYLARAFERMRIERKKAEEELRAKHQQLLDIIEFLPDATFVINQDKRVIAWNRAMEEITGVRKEDIIGKENYASVLPFYLNQQQPLLVDLIFLNHANQANGLVKITEKTLSKEVFLPPNGEGEGTYLLITAGPLYNNEGQLVGAVKSLRDITDRKLVEKQLRYLATHDSLTGLPNRLFLEEKIKQAVAQAKQGKGSALLLIDLDNFKLVNDTLGHDAGDKLLLTIAELLSSNLRSQDTLARLGGDEFVVLLDGAAAADALAVAEKIRSLLDENELCLVLYKHCFNISLSIGITMIDGAIPPHRLLALADTALYRAKETGRNRIVFLSCTEDEANSLSEANRIITLIKAALKENRFVLHYQPVVAINSRDIIHYEVLLRMQDDKGELIYPGKFIPVAERFGLMPRIDRWVVKSALEVLAARPDLSLFINLSGASLGDEKLLAYIEQTVHTNHIEPWRLGFEITETVAVKDLGRAGNWIKRLKNIGCRFSLDDFGIGFSSFSYLKILPVDYVKIDGSFIRNLHRDDTHYALVQAMQTVAHTLGKKTVAEFVENDQDLAKLKELNIDCAQGYLIGKPGPVPNGTDLATK
ncbi:EAL domain-containing protein [Desulforamulus hydrothermalis]|uniref:Diguanylate cyclase n=1 Tax=Desulforamulus hydrothermalis Lam5 = DSM 18033 TaxID=1121428 RepID=K8E8Z2_9FIRM|nr:EAL domain-containing protein [Desulforamulus hydrothermalis]CCO07988.1 Diguanylate cyclase [Desulforamulus hydrothermalis Lam5 = DSM 18033]SHG84716.1 PAS domain S-box-containing protein/diguanylate cyclase (GGDEF) domain-containing protein [Desulforamulus hydrothermalis Lam5 = DSM 18033]